MNFAFIKGLYDTLDLFSEELSLALERSGHKCIFLTVENIGESLPSLIEFHVIHHLDAVIAFNNLGYNLGTKEGGNLWDALDVLYIDILMDHPFHFDRVLSSLPERNMVFAIDRNHCSYLERYYPNVKKALFLPHAGCAYAVEKAKKEKKENSRDIDVLYAGALSRVLIESLIPDFDSIKEFDGAAFSGRCLERLINEPSLTTEECIRQELINEGLSGLSLERERELITDFRFLDGYAASFYREQAVRVLVENGIKVSVLGLGWEQCDWSDNENLIILGKVSAKEVIPYMLRSKVVLNTLTWFKEGSHDRIINGMLSGACVISDDSGYLSEAFSNGECIRYGLKETGRLPSLVMEMLSDDDKREAVADRGRAEALLNHTWKSRADIIINAIKELK